MQKYFFYLRNTTYFCAKTSNRRHIDVVRVNCRVFKPLIMIEIFWTFSPNILVYNFFYNFLPNSRVQILENLNSGMIETWKSWSSIISTKFKYYLCLKIPLSHKQKQSISTKTPAWTDTFPWERLCLSSKSHGKFNGSWLTSYPCHQTDFTHLLYVVKRAFQFRHRLIQKTDPETSVQKSWLSLLNGCGVGRFTSINWVCVFFFYMDLQLLKWILF